MTRFERLYRLILLILMLVTFWLPTSGGHPYVPLWNTLLVGAGMFLTGEFEPLFPYFFYVIGLPWLFVFNIGLLVSPARALKGLYRISMVFFVSIKWHVAVQLRVWEDGWGLLAELILISIGALLEAVFVFPGFLGGNLKRADN